MGEINNLANINLKGLKKRKPKLEANGYICPFYETNKRLRDPELYNKFVKNIESLVRCSKEYANYKNYLMKEIGLNYCMIFPNITDQIEGVTLELHHGPLLTLYDCCCIIIDHYLKNDIKVSSMRIFKAVITEHYNNNINCMILCDLAHKLYHAQKIYINPKQSWGYTTKFLEKYKDGLDDRMKMIINKNLELSTKYNSIDNDGILDSYITRWDKGELDDGDDLGLKENWEENPVNPLVKK